MIAQLVHRHALPRRRQELRDERVDSRAAWRGPLAGVSGGSPIDCSPDMVLLEGPWPSTHLGVPQRTPRSLCVLGADPFCFGSEVELQPNLETGVRQRHTPSQGICVMNGGPQLVGGPAVHVQHHPALVHGLQPLCGLEGIQALDNMVRCALPVLGGKDSHLDTFRADVPVVHEAVEIPRLCLLPLRSNDEEAGVAERCTTCSQAHGSPASSPRLRPSRGNAPKRPCR